MKKNMSRMKDGGKIYLSPGAKEAAKMLGKKKGPTTKKTNGTPKKKYKGMMGGGKVMKYSMGGKIDGIALKGKTRGRNR